MPHSTAFHSREPLRSHRALKLQQDRVSGPLSFLNPTRATFEHAPIPDQSQVRLADGDANQAEGGPPCQKEAVSIKDDEQLVSNIAFKWRSRDNRKGRHALAVDPSSSPSALYFSPRVSSTLGETARGLLRMCTQFPYWDISYLVATIFTLGSCVWVINAFFVWLPLANPGTEFHSEILTGGGVSAFVGATIFEVGSLLLMIEAINENRQGCFGWALERAISGENGAEGKIRVRPDKSSCEHHHSNKKNFVGKGSVDGPSAADSSGSSGSSTGEVGKQANTDSPDRTWQWFPSRYDLTTHYIRELGFLASLAQFLGATIFWISGFTALPGINNKMSQGLLDGIYWTPQIVGGCGFIISGALFMLETQQVWFKPAFGVLGWHIGFWNLIGAFGFTLCGALGPVYANSGAEYEASLATFWGSWAFLIGSAVQWYESLDKHPVEVKSNGP